MDVNSNKYTYIFATVMVVLVAITLSSLFLALKPAQDKNIEEEKRQFILRSIGVEVERSESNVAFAKYITQSLVIKNGQVVSEDAQLAFTIDMAKAVESSAETREVPLFVADVDGTKFYIVPMRGKGLWGPIWGYIALKEDANTVAGATFDHKGETPGLGAEISGAAYQALFVGKEISKAGEFVSISIVKPEKSVSPKNEVDAISGGTITSNGLHDMIADCFKPYVGYFKSQTQQTSAL